MRITLLVILLLTSFNSNARDCVVLLHGLARSAGAMETMQQALEEAGYHTVNVDYPSRDYSVEALAPMAIAPALAKPSYSFCYPFNGRYFAAAISAAQCHYRFRPGSDDGAAESG